MTTAACIPAKKCNSMSPAPMARSRAPTTDANATIRTGVKSKSRTAVAWRSVRIGRRSVCRSGASSRMNAVEQEGGYRRFFVQRDKA